MSDAELVLAMDPYRESACTLFMRAGMAAGNRAYAVAAYEHMRTRLAQDLGTTPSGETEAVLLEVLAGGTAAGARRSAEHAGGLPP